MNCSFHLDRTAVAQCNCGRGMCPECIDASEYKLENKPLCRECNYELINDMIKEDQSLKVKTLIKLIINALFIIIGLIVFFSGESISTSIILFAIGGIPTAWKMTSPSERDKWENRVDDKLADIDSVGGGLVNSFIRFLVRLFLTVVFGAVAAPILLIVNIVKFFKCKKRIERNETLLLNFA